VSIETAGDEVQRPFKPVRARETGGGRAMAESAPRRRRVLTNDELYIARSAKDAAWSAAEAAREAAENARRANVLAAIAIAIACGSVILVWVWN